MLVPIVQVLSKSTTLQVILDSGSAMASLSSLQNRHGMVYLNDDSSSGEGFAEADHNHSAVAAVVTLPCVEQASSRSSSRGGESEASYEDVYSSSDDSYHSDCDDIAEYWDPYCKKLALYILYCMDECK